MDEQNKDFSPVEFIQITDTKISVNFNSVP
jgi:hypothetical protein